MVNNPILYTAIIILWLVAFLGILNIASVSGIIIVMSLAYILGSMEASIIAQWAQWSPDYKKWNRSISMHTGMYWHQNLWYWRLLSSSAEVSGYLKYELRINGTVLCFWGSLRCIKIWLLIYWRGFKFPHRTVVLLPQDSDAACTILNCPSARKNAMLL